MNISCRYCWITDIFRLPVFYCTRWRRCSLLCLTVLSVALVFYWRQWLQIPKHRMPCPLTLSQSELLPAQTETTSASDNIPINCAALFTANHSEVNRARKYEYCYHHNEITPESLLKLTKDCQHFHKVTNIYNHKVTEEEKDFPIAFSVLVYKNIEQVVRLIQTIYRPQNVYCIHIDQKAPPVFKQALSDMTKCFKNVFIASKYVDVRWAEFSVLEAEIVCLRDLWNYTKWKYFINLTGMEFPIRTNWELVQILKSYKGANDIDGTPHK